MIPRPLGNATSVLVGLALGAGQAADFVTLLKLR
jgi:hypothetical protein